MRLHSHRLFAPLRSMLPKIGRYVLLLALCLSITSRREAVAKAQTTLTRFTALARKIKHHTAEQARPDMAWIKTMDLLIDATAHQCLLHPGSTDDAIEKRMVRFAKALQPTQKDSDIGLPTWFAIHTARHNDLIAIAVTLGHASRLRLVYLRSRRTVRVPAEFRWLVDWQPAPHFAPDGSLILCSDSVQEMGNRTGLRIDSLLFAGNRLRWKKTLVRTNTLDWGGAQIHGNRLRVDSLEDPQSFYTCAAEALFRRQEDYQIVRGDLKLIQTKHQDNVLRAIDRWILRARHTSHPDKEQALVRTLFPDEQMLDTYTLSKPTRNRTRVVTSFDSATLIFEVTTRHGKPKVRLISAKD